VRQQVDKLSEKVENISRQAAGATAIDETSVYEELREREQRKTNVVIYGMKEAPARYTGIIGGTGTRTAVGTSSEH
jgi:hypothetical protein